jgi:hypothetical protein
VRAWLTKIRHIPNIDGHEATGLGISHKELAIYDSFWKDMSKDVGIVSADFRSCVLLVWPDAILTSGSSQAAAG